MKYITVSFKNHSFLPAALFTLHNIEEAMFMPRFLLSHNHLPIPNISSPAFLFSLAAVTAAGWILSLYAISTKNKTISRLLLCGFASMMLINAFFPHIIGALVLWEYTPGLVTSMMLYVPVMSMYLMSLRYDTDISTRGFWVSIIIGFIVGALLTYIFMSIAHLFF